MGDDRPAIFQITGRIMSSGPLGRLLMEMSDGSIRYIGSTEPEDMIEGIRRPSVPTGYSTTTITQKRDKPKSYRQDRDLEEDTDMSVLAVSRSHTTLNAELSRMAEELAHYHASHISQKTGRRYDDIYTQERDRLTKRTPRQVRGEYVAHLSGEHKNKGPKMPTQKRQKTKKESPQFALSF